MKIYAISVFGQQTAGEKSNELATVKDLASFGYFERKSVGEFITFFSRTAAERAVPGSRTSIEEKEYVCHVHCRQNGLVGIVIADYDYPVLNAFSLINKVVNEFEAKYPPGTRSSQSRDMPFPQLSELLMKYQDPATADPLAKMQHDLLEIKSIMRTNLEHVLERGEKIDDLVQKSDDLSREAKRFYKTAKKLNSCCTLL